VDFFSFVDGEREIELHDDDEEENESSLFQTDGFVLQ
jgi:hypothetical protein